MSQSKEVGQKVSVVEIALFDVIEAAMYVGQDRKGWYTELVKRVSDNFGISKTRVRRLLEKL